MKSEKLHPASKKEIERIIEGFAHSAEFLFKAGYDGVELYGAHGYLLSQPLSPTTNQRTDEYGGSFENRSRIIIEIAEAIRKRIFILGIKINSVEFQNKGLDTSECRKLCADLENHKFDFVELSGDTYEEPAFQHKLESTKKREAFFLGFAETIVPGLSKTKTCVTGTIRAMVKALQAVDGVGLARLLCQEFNLCKTILSGQVKDATKQRLDDNDLD